jgi:hypothetical protein
MRSKFHPPEEAPPWKVSPDVVPDFGAPARPSLASHCTRYPPALDFNVSKGKESRFIGITTLPLDSLSWFLVVYSFCTVILPLPARCIATTCHVYCDHQQTLLQHENSSVSTILLLQDDQLSPSFTLIKGIIAFAADADGIPARHTEFSNQGRYTKRAAGDVPAACLSTYLDTRATQSANGTVLHSQSISWNRKVTVE